MDKTLLLMACLTLVACDTEPTCQERGGKEVKSGTILVPQRIGNVTTFIHIPKYDCVIEPGG